jgi:hypothetical protein
MRVCACADKEDEDQQQRLEVEEGRLQIVNNDEINGGFPFAYHCDKSDFTVDDRSLSNNYLKVAVDKVGLLVSTRCTG